MHYKIIDLQNNITSIGEGSSIPGGSIEITDADYLDILEGRVGAHIPTVEELAELAVALKWKVVDDYESELTVTMLNGNKYAANSKARSHIQEHINTLPFDATMTWIEEWGTFSTNIVELKEVLNEATRLIRVFTNTTFGV